MKGKKAQPVSKRVLIIDDEDVVRESFVLAFKDTDYEADGAESGEKGIELLRNTKYDLIFLDLKMPVMNGVETLREIHKLDKEAPVFIVTAFHEEFLGKLSELEKDKISFEVVRKPIGKNEITLIAGSVLSGPVAL
ncbi:MAG: response regulator [Deltaproteobacteria bacterium]